MWVGVEADDRFGNIVFSDPGMLPMYLITGTYYSEGKNLCNEIFYHFTSNSLTNYFNSFWQVAGGFMSIW